MKFGVNGQSIYARFVPLIVAGTSEYLTATGKNYKLTITNGVVIPIEVV